MTDEVSSRGVKYITADADNSKVGVIFSTCWVGRKEQQHLIYTLVNLKSKYLIMKDSARGIVLLNLTTNRHKTSHGLCVTAKLLV